MKVQLLVHPDSNEAWWPIWYAGVVAGAPSEIEFSVKSVESDAHLDRGADVIILARYPLFTPTLLDQINHMGVRAILVDHGTDSPYAVGYHSLINAAPYDHPAVAAVALPTPSIARFHQRVYEIPDTVAVVGVGFPYPDRYRNLGHGQGRRAKSVIFNQRIEDDTCPLVAFQIAELLLDHGYTVTFTSPGPIDPKWPVRLWRREITVHESLPRAAYLAHLETHEFAISTGFHGTTWVGGFEASLMGVIPIAPNRPGFCDPYPIRYDLDSLRGLPGIMEDAKESGESTVDADWFDPTSWWTRLLEAL